MKNKLKLQLTIYIITSINNSLCCDQTRPKTFNNFYNYNLPTSDFKDSAEKTPLELEIYTAKLKIENRQQLQTSFINNFYNYIPDPTSNFGNFAQKILLELKENELKLSKSLSFINAQINPTKTILFDYIVTKYTNEKDMFNKFIEIVNMKRYSMEKERLITAGQDIKELNKLTNYFYTIQNIDFNLENIFFINNTINQIYTKLIEWINYIIKIFQSTSDEWKEKYNIYIPILNSMKDFITDCQNWERLHHLDDSYPDSKERRKTYQENNSSSKLIFIPHTSNKFFLSIEAHNEQTPQNDLQQYEIAQQKRKEELEIIKLEQEIAILKPEVINQKQILDELLKEEEYTKIINKLKIENRKLRQNLIVINQMDLLQ